MDSAGARLMIVGIVLLAVFLAGAAYTHMEASRWERYASTRQVEYTNQTMARDLGRAVTPDRGLLQSADEKFGVYRWVCWGGVGLGALLALIGWSVAPRGKANNPPRS